MNPLERTRPAPDPCPRDSRFPGLAHDWHGWAWTRLQLAARGAAPDGARFRRALHERLRREAASAPPRFSSHLIGSAAAPLIAALAGRDDASFRKLLPALLRRWAASARRCVQRDVMLGGAGAILAFCEIEAAVPGCVPAAAVRRLVRETEESLRADLSGGVPYLGFAHGLAGGAFSLRAARAVFGFGANAPLVTQCAETLARERLDGPFGTAAWPERAGGADIDIQGWCHGGPGIGLALACSDRLEGRGGFTDLSRRALEGARRFDPGADNFCCGSVGRVQILIEAYRLSGRTDWLAKARAAAERLAARAAGAPAPRRAPRGFHKGALGLRYLAERLACPDGLPLPGLGPLSVPAR